MDLAGKNVAIIGVGGIGRELVQLLDRKGVGIFFIGDNSFDSFYETGEDSIEKNFAADVCPEYVDVTDEGSRDNWFTLLGRVMEEKKIQFQIFIYTAGVIGPVGKKSLPQYEEIKRTTQINYLSAVYFVNRFAEEIFRPAKFGRIITIGSMAGYIPTPSAKTYDASKAALNAYMEAFASTMDMWNELEDSDIKSNNFAFRMVETNMTKGMRDQDREREFKRFKQSKRGYIAPKDAAFEVVNALETDRHGSILDGTSFTMRYALQNMRDAIPSI